MIQSPSEAKKIPLTKGQVALVDEKDYSYLSSFRWYAKWNRRNSSFYAARAIRLPNGKQHVLYMHRVVLGLKIEDKRKGDHANRNTLDNRSSNLRIATTEQNNRNSRKRKDNKSGYKGVSLLPSGNWRATIAVSGKRKHLGVFSDPKEAHLAYCKAAHTHHGEFARIE